jgi:hypothetical protein
MAKGGYRKPANPAPVSGPGALSRRTDGGPVQGAKEIPGGGKYGERKELADIQSSAPMQGNPVPSAPRPVVAPPRPVTNLFAPTERPDEPVTAGAPVGAGRTPEVAQNGRYVVVSKYMDQLREMAAGDAPESFKIFFKYIEAANRMDEINATR